MEYRKLGGPGVKTSLLGFGCMRLPTLEGGAIDEARARAMVDRAIEAGINYFDTAYNYHGGESEPFTGRALGRYPRESYHLATKLPTYLIKSLDDAKQIFARQLERLRTDYVDFYLLHTLNGKRFQLMVELGVVDYCLELQALGKIRNFGFSFHDEYPAFQRIMDHHRWDFCQIQLNYLDTEEQAGMAGYRLAEERGVPLVIMEPVKGGALAAPPAEVAELFRRAGPAASPASWALRWAAGLPNVLTVLSGMSTLGQLEDNLATFAPFRPLDTGELALVEEAAARFRGRVKNGCTGCRYCMPCPAGVDIPGTFSVWNGWGMFADLRRSTKEWGEQGPGARPEHCVSCGKCEEACPQGLDIRADLARARLELDGLEAGRG